MLKQYWNSRFLKTFENALVLKSICQVGVCPRQTGTTVHWLRLNNLPNAPSSITEGTDPSAQTGSTTDVSGTLTQYGDSMKLSDVYLGTAIGGTWEQTLDRLAYQAAKKIDDVIGAAAYVDQAATMQYADGLVARNSIPQSTTTYLTVEEVRKAVRTLEKFGAPTFNDGFYRGVTRTETKYDIQGDSNWQDFVKYRDTVKPDIKNEIGEIWNVRWMQSQNIPVHDNSGSASANLYGVLVTSPEFMGISELYDIETIVKNPSPASSLNLYSTAGWKAMFLARALSQSGAVQILCSQSS